MLAAKRRVGDRRSLLRREILSGAFFQMPSIPL
jgi:hypothetical protein